MKKLFVSVVASVILFTLFLSTVVSAAASETVYSANRGGIFLYKKNATSPKQQIEFRLLEQMQGMDADREVTSSSVYNASARPNEQWMVFHFTVNFISGTGTLNMKDLFVGDDNDGVYFTAGGVKMKIAAFAVFEYKHGQNNAYQITLRPGQSADVWVGLKFSSNYDYPIMKIPASINDDLSTIWMSLAPGFDTTTIREIPNAVAVTYTNYNQINIKWDMIANANGYIVYRATSPGGSYKNIGTTTKTSFSNTGLAINKTYYYKVCAVYKSGSKNIYSALSSYVSGKTLTYAPKTIKLVKASATSSKLTWSKVTGATGYAIYRSNYVDKGFKLIASTKSTSYVNTKLTKGKTYYYMIKSYHTVGKTNYYGPYSYILSIKM